MSLLSATHNIGIGDSFLVLLIGMVIIFAVLAVLVGVIMAYAGIFRAADKKLAGKKPKEVPAPSAPEASSAAPLEDDKELVAAITAAIAVVMADERGDDDVPPFVIRSIFKK